jgi:hypothetical protein
VIDDPSDIGPGRRLLGWIALLIFILTFIYNPISAGGL